MPIERVTARRSDDSNLLMLLKKGMRRYETRKDGVVDVTILQRQGDMLRQNVERKGNRILELRFGGFSKSRFMTLASERLLRKREGRRPQDSWPRQRW